MPAVDYNLAPSTASDWLSTVFRGVFTGSTFFLLVSCCAGSCATDSDEYGQQLSGTYALIDVALQSCLKLCNTTVLAPGVYAATTATLSCRLHTAAGRRSSPILRLPIQSSASECTLHLWKL